MKLEVVYLLLALKRICIGDNFEGGLEWAKFTAAIKAAAALGSKKGGRRE